MATTDRLSGQASETGLAIKAPCAVATTGNISLSGVQTIDGVVVGNASERVLVKNQTDATQNGIYLASSGNWTRAIDAAGNTDWTAGTLVFVSGGAANAAAIFRQTCHDIPVVIGTSSIGFQVAVNGALTLRLFGAVGDGVADDTAAIQACVNAANGVVPILVPAGTFTISAAGGVSLPANTVFIGQGSTASQFKLLGTSPVFQMFLDQNGGNVGFYEIGFYGNSVDGAVGGSSAGAFFMLNTITSGPAFLYGPRFVNCYFENFGGENWIKIGFGAVGSIPVRNTYIVGNRFKSYPGNLSGAHSIGINDTCIGIAGSQSNTSGQVLGTIIANNYADCGGIKGFCFLYANTKDSVVAHNTVIDCGKLADNNVGSYGVLLYNNYGTIYGGSDASYPHYLLARPTGKVIGNTITGCRDTGVYGAHSLDTMILGNRIDTTLNGAPVALAIGGIAIDGGENILIDHNLVRNSAAGSVLVGGIVVVAIGAQGATIGSGNKIVNSAAGAYGIVVLPNTSASDTQGPVEIGDVRIDLTGATSDGIVLSSVGGNNLGQVYIKSPKINVTYSGIFCFDQGGVLGLGVSLLKIENPVITSFTNSGIYANLIITGRVEIGSPVLDMTSAPLGIVLDGSTDFSLLCPTFKNAASGSALSTSAASKGTIQDGIFRSCAAGHLANVLGTSAPTFTYDAGSFIKNFTPSAAGGATGANPPTAYFVNGWKNLTGGSTWIEDRCWY